MKLRFKGGRTEKVQVKGREVEREQLTQMLEQTEYFFPERGAVVSVPSPVGSWLLYKHGKYLEEVPEEAIESESGSPRRIVAVVPSDTKGKPPAGPGGEKP